MINFVEVLVFCVFWIDEIDKVFGSMDSYGDGGIISRVFGVFIIWLVEKIFFVFVVVIVNNV